jgi:oligosaccharyltransferase complex subunit alpha (ribophorin I)
MRYCSLPSNNYVSFQGEDDAGRSDGNNKIIFGPLESIQPMSNSTMTCHYEYLDPIITITKLRREMELSHWGSNLAVEEHYSLRHDGAR